ncbi:MAG: DUF2235 domain-containing protein [Pseudonocardia sp.]
MRHLVVCCDGTWNTPDQEKQGVPTPTNVVRLHHALDAGPDQLRYYHPGVGTEAGLINKMRGGALGEGLADNIKSAYSWLATHYQDGDAICMFGFSRGAYTVRSLAGMMAACGLARIPADTRPEERWAEIDRLYHEVYRPPDRDQPTPAAPHQQVPIRFLGVWDTVGALGIPDSFGVLNLFDAGDRHRFHDTKLNPFVAHARHAVALDERRGPFTPTLWDESGMPEPKVDRSVRQRWFSGDHSDVGGGHLQTGLSDGALLWMIDEARACTGLSFRKEMLEQVHPDPCDVLHDSCTGIYLRLSPTPRAIPLIDEQRSTDIVDGSVFIRQARPPIAAGAYRPSRVLAVGETVSCAVFANEPWNAPGWYLEPGQYAFEATGEWLDRGVPVGPRGTQDGHFYPTELSQLIGSFAAWWQERFREWTGNTAATFFGTPRTADDPWTALIGVVAAKELDADGVQQKYQSFMIGDGCEQRVEQPGYFYAYANDAWGFYDNNKGSVTLTVTRLAP